MSFAAINPNSYALVASVLSSWAWLAVYAMSRVLPELERQESAVSSGQTLATAIAGPNARPAARTSAHRS